MFDVYAPHVPPTVAAAVRTFLQYRNRHIRSFHFGDLATTAETDLWVHKPSTGEWSRPELPPHEEARLADRACQRWEYPSMRWYQRHEQLPTELLAPSECDWQAVDDLRDDILTHCCRDVLDRAIVELRTTEQQLTQTQIGEYLGLSQGQISQRIARIKARYKSSLN